MGFLVADPTIVYGVGPNSSARAYITDVSTSLHRAALKAEREEMSTKPHRNSIESADTPLVHKAGGKVDIASPQYEYPTFGFRVATRALEGMQKEALVAQSHDDIVWRIVCDEGPYLNGTDLAPPPSAFFSAGMASSIAAGILSCSRRHGADIADLEIVQDNLYSMDGSAVRDTMVAGALPVELSVSARVSGGKADLNTIVNEALATSPIDALMRDVLLGTFSITRNGQRLSPPVVAASSNPTPNDPAVLFSDYCYVEEDQQILDVIS